MKRFQILCVTMNQNDFKKIDEMNINSDIVFANQAGEVWYKKYEFDGHTAQMITTNTIGVGKNRNISLMYADAEICLLADDDMLYRSDLEDVILETFDTIKDADVCIFNIESNSLERPEKMNRRTRSVHFFERMPYGAVRIAFRLSAIKKANICFTSLFGGGALFSAGEDSMFISDLKRKGLRIYVSDQVIGKTNFEVSTWFDGYNEKYFYSKGAYCAQTHPKTKLLWIIYYAIRTGKMTKMSFVQKIVWMLDGAKGFRDLMPHNMDIK